MPVTVRLFFSKTGRAKYISHLDTMRTITRAVRRSGLPFWHTEGFNPHLYLTFALPIALGCEGLCESMDAKYLEEPDFDRIVRVLNAQMPQGFAILRADYPRMEPAEIAWARYGVELLYPPEALAGMLLKLREFSLLPEVRALKRTKKGEKELDIRPLFELLDVQPQSDRLTLELKLAAGIETNLNPALFVKAFSDFAGQKPEAVRPARKAICNARGEEFC